MSNTAVTVIFNNVEEFVAELREAGKDQPRPEVVRLTHRHADADMTKRLAVIAGFVTDHGPVPEIIVLNAHCGEFMFGDAEDKEAAKVRGRAAAIREKLTTACNELGLSVRGGAYATGA